MCRKKQYGQLRQTVKAYDKGDTGGGGGVGTPKAYTSNARNILGSPNSLRPCVLVRVPIGRAQEAQPTR